MKTLQMLSLVALAAVIGCGRSSTAPPTASDGAPATDPADATLAALAPVSLKVCSDCGQAEGSEACCDEDAEACECGFHKGSIACCKAEKGDQLAICSDCGQLVGGEACCAEGAEVCGCGWHKGSLACCKLDKAEAESLAAAAAGPKEGSGKKTGGDGPDGDGPDGEKEA